jgi:hypothetical protein
MAWQRDSEGRPVPADPYLSTPEEITWIEEINDPASLPRQNFFALTSFTDDGVIADSPEAETDEEVEWEGELSGVDDAELEAWRDIAPFIDKSDPVPERRLANMRALWQAHYWSIANQRVNDRRFNLQEQWVNLRRLRTDKWILSRRPSDIPPRCKQCHCGGGGASGATDVGSHERGHAHCAPRLLNCITQHCRLRSPTP